MVCSARAGGRPGGRGGHSKAEAAAVADISFLGSWAEMEPQTAHLDGEPRLAFAVDPAGLEPQKYVYDPPVSK